MNAEWVHVRSLFFAVMLFVAATQAQAQITYVDANDGNTTINGNPMDIQNQNTSGTYVSGVDFNVSDDDFTGGATEWKQRDWFANGSSSNAFETALSPSTEILNTSVSGLAAGTYRVYAYFWDASSPHDWDLAAELNSGGYRDKASGSAWVVAASNQSFTASVLTTEGNRTMYAIDLGTFVGTGFTVNAKGGTAGSGGNNTTDVRTWYDGVGYEADSFQDYFSDTLAGSGSASAPGSFASDATTASAEVSDYIVDLNSVGIVNSAGNVGNPTPGLNLFGGGSETNAFHLNLATVEGATYSVECQVSMWGSDTGTRSYALSASAFDGTDTITGNAVGSDLIEQPSASFTIKTIDFDFVAASTTTTLYFDGGIVDTVSHDVWIDNLKIRVDLSTRKYGGTLFSFQ